MAENEQGGLDSQSSDDSKTRYQQPRLLGHGGMASVYSAYDTLLESTIALKVLHPHLLNEIIVRRLRREVLLSRQIVHPNVIKTYDLAEFQGNPTIVMELVSGGSLRDKLDLQQGLIEEREAVKLLYQIAAGLDAAHSLGIIHRDLKPHNILMDESQDLAKIADFGLAFSALDEDMQLTAEGTVCGTPPYMAPEIFKGDLYDTRSDFYAFGVLGYEVLTGALPIRGKTFMEYCHLHQFEEPVPLSQKRPSLNRALEYLVMKCLQKSPEDRFQASFELVDALGNLINEYDIEENSNHRNSLDHTFAEGEAGNEHQHLQPGRIETNQQSQQSNEKCTVATSDICPSCKEQIPPQLSNCAFCESKTLLKFGEGNWSVILCQPPDWSFFHYVLKSIGFGKKQTTNTLSVKERILDHIAAASGSSRLPISQSLEILDNLPCELLPNLSESDADEFIAKLRALDLHLNKVKLGFFTNMLAKSPFNLLMNKILVVAGSIITISSAFVVSLVSFYFIIKMFTNLSEVSTIALKAFLLLQQPFAFMAVGLGILAIPYFYLKGKVPLKSFRSIFRKMDKRKTLSTWPELLEHMQQILPKIKEKDLRQIITGILGLENRLQKLLPSAQKQTTVECLKTCLDLSLIIQEARDQRQLHSQSRSIPKHEHHEQNRDETEHNQPGSQETWAFTKLLQLRARIERLCTNLQLAQSQQTSKESIINELADELTIEIEAINEMEEFFGKVTVSQP